MMIFAHRSRLGRSSCGRLEESIQHQQPGARVSRALPNGMSRLVRRSSCEINSRAERDLNLRCKLLIAKEKMVAGA
jgi:hypothetical protein